MICCVRPRESRRVTVRVCPAHFICTLRWSAPPGATPGERFAGNPLACLDVLTLKAMDACGAGEMATHCHAIGWTPVFVIVCEPEHSCPCPLALPRWSALKDKGGRAAEGLVALGVFVGLGLGACVAVAAGMSARS